MGSRIESTTRRSQNSARHQSSPRSPQLNSSHSPTSPHTSFSRRLLVPILRPNIRSSFSSPPSSPSPSFSTPLPSPHHQSPRQRIRHTTPLPSLAATASRADGSISSSTSSANNTATTSPNSLRMRRELSRTASQRAKAAQVRAQKENDSMIYLDGPLVYTCAQCRTHLTSHDDIISKSFHGRHGRAYLFDHCVNVTTGPAEDRLLITGLHSVCDIFCKRCKRMVGWTYSKAYEPSQKYKEGKFIIEKINLHMEESYYDVSHPAGERHDRWRKRSMSWGNGEHSCELVYEYRPESATTTPTGMGRSPLLSGKSPKSTTSINGNGMPPPPFL